MKNEIPHMQALKDIIANVVYHREVKTQNIVHLLRAVNHENSNTWKAITEVVRSKQLQPKAFQGIDEPGVPKLTVIGYSYPIDELGKLNEDLPYISTDEHDEVIITHTFPKESVKKAYFEYINILTTLATIMEIDCPGCCNTIKTLVISQDGLFAKTFCPIYYH